MLAATALLVPTWYLVVETVRLGEYSARKRSGGASPGNGSCYFHIHGASPKGMMAVMNDHAKGTKAILVMCVRAEVLYRA